MLDRGNGIDSWGHATLAGSGQWDCFMGACDGGTRQWLDRGVGIDSWGVAVGVCNTGWIGAMGLIHGGVQQWLQRGDGIDSWGLAMVVTRVRVVPFHRLHCSLHSLSHPVPLPSVIHPPDQYRPRTPYPLCILHPPCPQLTPLPPLPNTQNPIYSDPLVV